MGGRKQKMMEPKSGIYIIGEGITEQYYFTHIKKIFGVHCTIKPRFFGNTSILQMRKKIEELIRADIFVICVFDADVVAYNKVERKKLEQLQNKYRMKENVLFCGSLPSIEFWFILHYEDTNRNFSNAQEVVDALKRYIKDYEKTTRFLKKEKWVKDLSSNGKQSQAIERAKRFNSKHGSYTNMHLAFNVLFEDKNKRQS